ncbi:hypothetical protein, partial [uncultured Desulfovibrio sp.]|uniref:hypothetical protein n=1 Tax=uncultured Desulfovibrio sp. TaxID=167968 RepID=UPI00262A243B
KTAFFPRNDRSYGLKRAAFQTEIALLCPGNSAPDADTGKAPGRLTAARSFFNVPDLSREPSRKKVTTVFSAAVH